MPNDTIPDTHTHDEYISYDAHERAIERLSKQIDRLSYRIDELERQLNYKAEDRHDHRGYADERHYH